MGSFKRELAAAVMMTALFQGAGEAVADGGQPSIVDREEYRSELRQLGRHLERTCEVTRENPVRAAMAEGLIQKTEHRLDELARKVRVVNGFLRDPDGAIHRQRDEAFRERMERASAELEAEAGRLESMNHAPRRHGRLSTEMRRRQRESVRRLRERLISVRAEHAAGAPERNPAAATRAVDAALADLSLLGKISDRYQKIQDEASYCHWLALGKPGTLYDPDAKKKEAGSAAAGAALPELDRDLDEMIADRQSEAAAAR